MYAACSFVVGSVTAAKPITDPACGWVWIGAVVWAVVFAATVRRAIHIVRDDSPPLTAPRVQEIARAGAAVGRFRR